MKNSGEASPARPGIAPLLAASPALFPLFLILHYGVNFHFWDEWDPEIAGIYIKAHQHQLTFGDLVSLHNEHRLLVPRLFHLLLNTFSQWNEVTAMLAGWVLVCITSLCVLCLIRRTVGENSGNYAVPLNWFFCNLLIFTGAQYENWLSGWGLDNAMPFAFIAIGIVVATSNINSWAQCAICLLLAAAASFSNGCGFAAWPLLGALLLWPTSRAPFRARMPLLVAWIVGFSLIAAFYFHHYQTPPPADAYEPSILRFLFYLIAFPANAFVGSTGFEWTRVCLTIGLIFYALFIAAVVEFVAAWRKKDFDFCRRLLIWLAVGGFSVLTAGMGATTRSGFGVGQVRISRYVTFSIYLAVALINLLPIIYQNPHRARPASPQWIRLIKSFPIALAILVLLSIPVSLKDSQHSQTQRLAGKAALMLVDILPNNEQLTPFVYKPVDRLIREAHALNEMGYLQPPLIASPDASLIAQDQTDSPAFAGGEFTQLHSTAPGIYVATGWAASPANHRQADAVFLTYDDKEGHPIIFQQAGIGFARPNIFRLLASPDYNPNGWTAQVIVSHLPSEMSNLRISAWALDTQTGKAILLGNHFFISR